MSAKLYRLSHSVRFLRRREHDHHGEPALQVVGRDKETRARLCGSTRIPTRVALLSPKGAVSDETAQTPS